MLSVTIIITMYSLSLTFSLVERSKEQKIGFLHCQAPWLLVLSYVMYLPLKNYPFQYMPSPLTSTPHDEILESHFFSLFSLFFALCT